ncbi:hypothetical protein HYT58_02015 [Candidatus Woesearchaeota archaeon]|nr:hypothetical protein [Candidatus Woesearchaeota archaeon]
MNNNLAALMTVVFIVMTLVGTYTLIHYIDRFTVSGEAAAVQGKVNLTINGYCGDGVVLAMDNETCESVSLNGETCITLKFDSGTLKCASDCRSFDTSGCVAAAPTGAGRPEVSERPANITILDKSHVYSIIVNKVYPTYIVFGENKYRLSVEIEEDRVTLTINPGEFSIDFVKGLEYGIDLDQDGSDDLVMVLDEVLTRRAAFRLWSIDLRKPIRAIPKVEKPTEEKIIVKPEEKYKLDNKLLLIFILILLITAFIYRRRKR